MVNNELLAELRDLALKIAPEITQPIYVLLEPDGFDMPDVAAVAIQGACPLLADILRADGRWRGAGPAIVFSDTEVSREVATACFIHEVAHLVPFRPTADVESTPETRAANGREMEAWRANPANQFDDVPAWLPDHGKQFHRIALHLWWRAAMTGVVAPLESLGFTAYGLSTCYSYWKALGNEAVLLKDRTFAEILEIEAPEQFTAWWRHDVTSWMNANPDSVTKAMEEAA